MMSVHKHIDGTKNNIQAVPEKVNEFQVLDELQGVLIKVNELQIEITPDIFSLQNQFRYYMAA